MKYSKLLWIIQMVHNKFIKYLDKELAKVDLFLASMDALLIKHEVDLK